MKVGSILYFFGMFLDCGIGRLCMGGFCVFFSGGIGIEILKVKVDGFFKD